MRNVCGIDPSLSGTGLCVGSGSDDWQTCRVGEKNRGDTIYHRVQRYVALVAQANAIVAAAEPGLILIEDYAYSKNGKVQEMLHEYGSLLRWHLVDHTPHVLKVKATTLKKFATGKGNTPKEQVIACVLERWGHRFESSDEADAFVLYQMALAIVGRMKTTKTQREAVDAVLKDYPVTATYLAHICDLEPAEVPF